MLIAIPGGGLLIFQEELAAGIIGWPVLRVLVYIFCILYSVWSSVWRSLAFWNSPLTK